MHSTGDSPQKKGAGYFASRLKEKGDVEDAPKPVEATQDKPEMISPDQTATTPKIGQIFEESTKSIAAMASDVSETARMASSMKEGIERVNKIKRLLTADPLCDDSGSCSFDGVNFDNSTSIKQSEEKIADIITDYAKSNIAELQLDTNSIRDELQQFKDTIKQKESQILQFREKLNQVKQQTMPNITNDSAGTELGLDPSHTNEFYAATDQDLINFNSIPKDDYDNLLAIQQQELKDGEKKLLELRWKIKKTEIDYEQKKIQADQVEDLSYKIEQLESKKDSLQAQVKSLENQNKEPKQELRELEQKISSAKKEYDEKLVALKEVQDARSVLEYLKLDKQALKSELDELRVKTKSADKEYQERKTASEKLEDVRFSVTSLQAEKETLQAELEQLRARIKKAESEIEQRQQEKERLGEFKAVVTHLKLEKESLEQELVELKSKAKKAEIDYEQKRISVQELQDVREVLAYLKPERDSLKSEISQLRDKIQKMEESYDDINAKKRQCQLEYDDLKFQIKKAESENSEKRNFSHFTR